MRNLQRCVIGYLDLETVHPSMYRFASSATSLRTLELGYCNTEDANHLCRFLTSFRSLSTLILSWSISVFLHEDEYDLPHPQFNRSKHSLQSLAIEGIPTISVLLKSFIKARPFVTYLRHFIFSWHYSYDETPSLSHEITGLLRHCSQSLEEVTMILGLLHDFSDRKAESTYIVH